jgi:hypothetical protein
MNIVFRERVLTESDSEGEDVMGLPVNDPRDLRIKEISPMHVKDLASIILDFCDDGELFKVWMVSLILVGLWELKIASNFKFVNTQKSPSLGQQRL